MMVELCNSRISILIGLLYFQIIHATQPDVMMVELCSSRINILIGLLYFQIIHATQPDVVMVELCLKIRIRTSP